MKNSFGNYVLQKALKLCNGFLKVKLTNNIKKNIEKISDTKLVNKWKSIITNCSANVLTFNNNQQAFGSPKSSGYETNSPNNSFNSQNSHNSYNNSFNSYGSHNMSPVLSNINLNFSNQIIGGPYHPGKFYSKSGTSSPKIPNMNIPFRQEFMNRRNSHFDS
jgi:hypothetical protein